MLFSADLLRDTALAAPLVLCGDFNMWSPSRPHPEALAHRTARRGVVSRSRRATYPSALPLLRLDRAYVDDGVDVLGCGVVNDPRTRAARRPPAALGGPRAEGVRAAPSRGKAGA